MLFLREGKKAARKAFVMMMIVWVIVMVVVVVGCLARFHSEQMSELSSLLAPLLIRLKGPLFLRFMKKIVRMGCSPSTYLPHPNPLVQGTAPFPTNPLPGYGLLPNLISHSICKRSM